MPNTLSMLDLARDLAQLASETRDPETAAKLIVLTNVVLVAAGHLPRSSEGGARHGSGGSRRQ